ncbi:probable LRR receptor-like protein kinase At1g51890 [Prosopis cineraria]|uniref:probable LRR receptor-like protein kinase At1g51890 n=1 Tax=Prosopis cineraria TaxID=364024 RepID=UPI00240FB520|nr:probable LRR receptor-like protein kinase At1g51890 [Prosopis cineraria]
MILKCICDFNYILSQISAPKFLFSCGASFISIDCGASKDYVDEVTGLWYQTDEEFIESGINYKLPPQVNFYNNPTVVRQLMTLRSFLDGERNCYTLKPKQEDPKKKQKYLMRAIFAYRNYDYINQLPVFDLYLGVNYWDTVQLPNSSYFKYYEIIMQQDAATVNKVRYDMGSGLPLSSTRFKDDMYDRLWVFDDGGHYGHLKTSVSKLEDSVYELPLEILDTASRPLYNNSNDLTANWSYDALKQYYLFLHFTKIQKLPSGHKRIINFTFDDDENSQSQQITLEYSKPLTLRSNNIPKGYVSFTVSAAANLDSPPILNAYEIYQLVPQPNSPTYTQDVNAIMEIKRTYGVSKTSWQGSPCVPSNFAWDGLICSNDNNIRIISFNVEGNKLTGSIPKAVREKANLQLRMRKLCKISSKDCRLSLVVSLGNSINGLQVATAHANGSLEILLASSNSVDWRSSHKVTFHGDPSARVSSHWCPGFKGYGIWSIILI